MGTKGRQELERTNMVSLLSLEMMLPLGLQQRLILQEVNHWGAEMLYLE